MSILKALSPMTIVGSAIGSAVGKSDGDSKLKMFEKLNKLKAQTRPIDISKDTQATAGDKALASISTGLSQAEETLSPLTSQAETLIPEITNLLMGKTATQDIPGYEDLVSARQEAVGALGTGMAGTGKFFSGTTGEKASDIGSEMSNRFRQQYLSNLLSGAASGQSAMGQLSGMQMGAGTASAQIPLSVQQLLMQEQQMLMQQEQMNQQLKAQKDANKSAFVSDLLGAGAMLAPFLMASDANLKENIKKIGKKGPYNWYQFNYKGDDKTYEGVMAHEVKEINPDAVIENDGYLIVDYGKL